MNLNIACIQSDLVWHNAAANLANFEEKIAKIDQPIDLIVLPEMFTTGFTMQPQAIAEVPKLHTHRWMQQMADRYNTAITGSYVVQENDSFYNRLLWVQPGGIFYYYDKKHLFRMGNEHQCYAPGQEKVILHWRGWNIRPLICYDLRFPVWSRNVANEYDLLLYVANWPAARAHVWNTLLVARALENQCYVLGVNRIGKDANDNDHDGNSQIIDYKGQTVADAGLKTETTIYGSLKLNELNDFREKFPAYLDADAFQIL